MVFSVEVVNREAGGEAGTTAAPAGQEKQALVEECVARVLEILRDREEP